MDAMLKLAFGRVENPDPERTKLLVDYYDGVLSDLERYINDVCEAAIKDKSRLKSCTDVNGKINWKLVTEASKDQHNDKN